MAMKNVHWVAVLALMCCGSEAWGGRITGPYMADGLGVVSYAPPLFETPEGPIDLGMITLEPAEEARITGNLVSTGGLANASLFLQISGSAPLEAIELAWSVSGSGSPGSPASTPSFTPSPFNFSSPLLQIEYLSSNSILLSGGVLAAGIGGPNNLLAIQLQIPEPQGAAWVTLSLTGRAVVPEPVTSLVALAAVFCFTRRSRPVLG
jgi:hypothetical protein